MNIWDARGHFRLTPARILTAIGRRIALPLNYVRLAIASKNSRHSLVDRVSDVTVTMTTHGERIKTVHLTIESIAHGSKLPGQVVLYLDAPLPSPLPAELRRLVSRGLEIRTSSGRYGPHTKYFPFVQGPEGGQRRLVTADDDLVYPPTWLEDLLTVAEKYPDDIICHRAHRITFNNGRLLPYNQWERFALPEASHLNFLTGVSGVIYPRVMQNHLAQAGPGFQKCCPRADDIWLNWVAFTNGVRVRQSSSIPRDYPSLMSTQKTSLLAENVNGHLNDSQFTATYSDYDIERLRILAERFKYT